MLGFLAANLLQAENLPALKSTAKGFVDASGREVILRGVNTGGRSKVPPFYPFEPVPDFDTALNRYADQVQSLGFNVVRLLVIYEAGEPVRGQYDEAYLKIYDRMVDAFSRRGIYIIIDSHQDLYSRRFCGDGFPDWAIPEKYRSMPQHADCKNWWTVDLTMPLMTSFDRFYANDDKIQDNYVAFFKMLAGRYRDNPAVLGFEPLNEPFPGLRGRMNMARWYQKELFPFYERVAKAVKEVDGRYLIFANLCPLENNGLWLPGHKRPKIENLVLAPHYYDAGTFGTGSGSNWIKKLIKRGLTLGRKLGDKWQTPVLFSEYGISPTYKGAEAYIGSVYERMDALKLSGTFWEASMSPYIWNMEYTSIFEPDGTVRKASFALARPYPMAVAGDINEFSFNTQTKEFRLAWNEDPAAKAPTEVYLPPSVYGKSPKIKVTAPKAPVALADALLFQFQPETGKLTISQIAIKQRRELTVTVK
jgi:endoglycosylceramidase